MTLYLVVRLALETQARQEVEKEALDLMWWIAQWDDYRTPPGWSSSAICTDYWWSYKEQEQSEVGRHAREIVDRAVWDRVAELME